MDFITLLSLTEPDDLIAVNQDANKPTTPNPQWPYNITTGGTSTTGGPPTTTGGTVTGGTWTSLPIPGSGIPTTSTGNGNITTSTGNAGGWAAPAGGAIGNLVNTLNTVSAAKVLVKDKMRIIIQKNDGSQLVLEEQTVVTPQEMVGLSKFFMLMSCATTVFSASGSGYNIKINWSEVVKNLSIERHFVTPMPLVAVPTNVLDITLFDPT
jgi:hypothetical protein